MTKKIPEIRFAGFSGEWEEKKLGDFGTVQMNKRIYKKETSENGEIPFYKIGSFGSKADTFISRELFEEYKEKYPYPEIGALLISASGSIGKVVEYKGEEAYFQDSNIVWLDHDDRISNKFLKQFYQVVRWDGIEGTTIKRLYNKNILSTKIRYPKIEEQEKTGELFEVLDACLEDQAVYVETLKKSKKAFLQKLFPQKGAKAPELRFPGFDGDWEVKKLGEFTDIRTGNKDVKDNDEDGEYPFFVRSNNMLKISTYSYDGEAILIPGDGNIGDVYHYINGKFDWHQRVYKISDFEETSGVYIYYYLQKFFKRHAMKNSVKATVNSLRLPTIKNFKIFLPSLAEQEKIGSFFKALDYKIEKEEDKLESFERLKTALLQKVFV